MASAKTPKQPEDNRTSDLIPTTYAYLRVSTDAQDVDNQRHGVLEYANQHGFSKLIFVEDSASGKTPWQGRKVGALLLETCQPGDTVIFAEISRMARSTLQVLEIVKHCVEQQINVHIAKSRMVLDGSLQSKITATVLGLAAEIEREFISMRTKEALAKRKADGVTLGRPRGKAVKIKLDDHAQTIQDYLNKGIGKRDIARLLNVSPSTLYDYIVRRGVTAKRPAN
ncbi:MAG: recombinase family protein [Gallionella sp.]|nr:recombinase family protein [Gallionella sp.]